MFVNIARPQSEQKTEIHYVFALPKSQIMRYNQHMLSCGEGTTDFSHFMTIAQQMSA